MKFYYRHLGRFARWAARKTGQRILPAGGAALLLSQDEPMRIELPDPSYFNDDASARSALMLISGAGIMLRDHKKNLTLYEALVCAAEDLGFGTSVGQVFAGSLINPQEVSS